MKHVYRLLTQAFFLFAPPRFAYVVWMDLQHPEIWDRDPVHDPLWYLPFSAVVLCAGVLLGWHIWSVETRALRKSK